MKQELQKLIEKECKKRIRKNTKRIRKIKQAGTIIERMTGIHQEKKLKKTIPFIWQREKQFNPYYVLKNASFYAKAVATSIKNGKYKPKPSLMFKIRKREPGRTREINVFSVVDAAVAKWLNENLIKNNAALLSSHAYAYRKDKNANHAINHLHFVATEHNKVFIGEYDFSDFHGNIQHDTLTATLRDRFITTERERRAIISLIKHDKATAEMYADQRFDTNKKGLPQGSAISMTLSNMYCYPLDVRLERSGASFARFADDIVIVSENEETANKCENILFDEATSRGFVISREKSQGISALVANPLKEPHDTKQSFDFLGHKVSQSISIADKSIARIKRHVTKIINKHLIYYPKRMVFSSRRYLNSLHIDWDLIACINSIRRYIYGNITEAKLSACLKDNAEPVQNVKNLLSHYPLVNDGNIFKELDGWLCYTLYYALKARSKLLSKYLADYRVPSKNQLITGEWYTGKYPIETRIPSFFKSWLYIQKSRKRGRRLDQFSTKVYY